LSPAYAPAIFVQSHMHLLLSQSGNITGHRSAKWPIAVFWTFMQYLPINAWIVMKSHDVLYEGSYTNFLTEIALELRSSGGLMPKPVAVGRIHDLHPWLQDDPNPMLRPDIHRLASQWCWPTDSFTSTRAYWRFLAVVARKSVAAAASAANLVQLGGPRRPRSSASPATRGFTRTVSMYLTRNRLNLWDSVSSRRRNALRLAAFPQMLSI
jgi:hypothetical protein